jgi:small subunit ribosomal protein S9
MAIKNKESRYVEAVGRRKTSTARARLFTSDVTDIEVNGKPISSYFPTNSQQATVQDPLTHEDVQRQFKITVKVQGGGLMSQAAAVRHAISRALVAIDESLRSPLKKSGFLKRDPRSKERKKFGLKKARKASQWSKR